MTATSPAPRPAQLPVGDLGVAATLDAAGDLTRLDYKLYGAIALLIVAPFQAFFVIAMGLLNPQTLPYNSAAFAIAAIANPEEAAATQPGNAILAMLLSLLFSALFAGVVVPLAMGAVSRAAALRYLGHGATIGDCLRWSGRHFFPLVLTNVLFWLSILVVTVVTAIIFFLPGVALGFLGGNVGGNLIVLVALLTIIGAGALVLVSLVVQLRLGLFYAVMAVEDLAYGAALGRSWRLSRGRFARVLWISAVLFLAVGYLSLGVQCLPNVLAYGILTSISSSVALVVSAVAMTVFYFNCRALHENLDIFLLAERGQALAAGAAADAAGALAAQTTEGGANG